MEISVNTEVVEIDTIVNKQTSKNIINNTSRFVWTLDPYDISTYSKHKQVIKLIQDDPTINVISSTEELIDQSVTQYTYIVYINGISDNLNNIIIMSTQISYVPVTLSLNIEYILSKNSYVVNGLKSIISAYVSKILDVTVSKVNVTSSGASDDENEVILTFEPVNANNLPIFRSNKSLEYLIYKMDLNSWVGWSFLSSDPLTLLSIKRIKSGFVPSQGDIRIKDGSLFIRVGDDYTRYSNDLSMITDSLKSDGYFSYPSTINEYINVYDLRLAYDLASKMNYEIILLDKVKSGLVSIDDLIPTRLSLDYTCNNESCTWNIVNDNYSVFEDEFNVPIDKSIIIIKNNNINYMSSQGWFNQAIQEIKVGTFPSYIIDLGIRDQYINNLLLDPISIKAKLEAASIRSYIRLAITNRSLIKFIKDIIVNPDFTVKIKIESIDDINKFKDRLDTFYDGNEQWVTLPISDVKDMVIKRWYLQINYPRLRTFVSIVDNSYYLTIMSFDSALINVPLDNSEYERSFITTVNNIYGSNANTFEDSLNVMYSASQLEVDNDIFMLGLRGLYTINPLNGFINKYPSENIENYDPDVDF